MVLKVSLMAALLYAAFIKTNAILSILGHWISVHLNVENELVVIIIQLVAGALAILILFNLYKNFLGKPQISIRSLWDMLALVLILFFIHTGINYGYGSYLTNHGHIMIESAFITQYSWAKIIDAIIPIIALVLFLLKLRNLSVESVEQDR